MRAFVITGPGRAEVRDIEPPEPGPGQVVVDVERAGVCGTDVEFFTGHMVYLRTGEARYPVRIGHEWCGTVTRAGDETGASWLGRRVTGDTMLGCGHCARCRTGRRGVGTDDGLEGGLQDGHPHRGQRRRVEDVRHGRDVGPNAFVPSGQRAPGKRLGRRDALQGKQKRGERQRHRDRTAQRGGRGDRARYCSNADPCRRGIR